MTATSRQMLVNMYNEHEWRKMIDGSRIKGTGAGAVEEGESRE